MNFENVEYMCLRSKEDDIKIDTMQILLLVILSAQVSLFEKMEK